MKEETWVKIKEGDKEWYAKLGDRPEIKELKDSVIGNYFSTCLVLLFVIINFLRSL